MEQVAFSGGQSGSECVEYSLAFTNMCKKDKMVSDYKQKMSITICDTHLKPVNY